MRKEKKNVNKNARAYLFIIAAGTDRLVERYTRGLNRYVRPIHTVHVLRNESTNGGVFYKRERVSFPGTRLD